MMSVRIINVQDFYFFSSMTQQKLVSLDVNIFKFKFNVSKAAARLYRERFPRRRHVSSEVFLRLVNRTRTTGYLVPDRK
jgi:hypothetical protein